MSHSGFGGTDVPDRGNSTCKGAEVVCPRTARKPMWLEWRGEGPLYKALGDSLRIWAFSLREREPRKGFQ